MSRPLLVNVFNTWRILIKNLNTDVDTSPPVGGEATHDWSLPSLCLANKIADQLGNKCMH